MEFGWDKLLAGGVFVGLIASFWQKIKAFAWRMAQYAIQKSSINEDLAIPVLNYILEKYQRSTIYDKYYSCSTSLLRETARRIYVPFEYIGNSSMVFWNGKIPMLVSPKNDNGDVQVQILAVRGTVDIDKLCNEAVEYFNSMLTDCTHKIPRFAVHRIPSIGSRGEKTGSGAPQSRTRELTSLPWWRLQQNRIIGYNPDELADAPMPLGNALDKLIFPESIYHLVDEIRRWKDSRDWYRERGIPWKRGYLLYGKPGTGKTALATAIAQDLNMPIYVYNLAQMNNDEFASAWEEMTASAPCMALIEDIDNVFHGRRNISRMNMFPGMMGPIGPDGNPMNAQGGEDGQQAAGDDAEGGQQGNMMQNGMGNGPMSPFQMLTFDGFLNTLDGVIRGEGVFTVITTNNIDKIDEALGKPRKTDDGKTEFISTRPGRIDKAIELLPMRPQDKIVMAQRLLGMYKELYNEIAESIKQNPEYLETPAQFRERCASLALARYWADKAEQEAKEEAETQQNDTAEPAIPELASTAD